MYTHLSVRLFLFIFFLSCLNFAIGGESKKIQAWQTTEEVTSIYMQLTDVEPSLPPPELESEAEAEYTMGNENTLYWNSARVKANLDEGISLVLFEIQARYDDKVLWGTVDADEGVDSATFVGLPEGVPIFYWLRYFAQDSNNEYRLSYWSEDTVCSIQDASPPVLDLVKSKILEVRSCGGSRWVEGQEIEMQIVAMDNIKIKGLAICEGSDTTFNNFRDPSSLINERIPYTINSPMKETIVLSWWVYDVASDTTSRDTTIQRSLETASDTIFWYPSQMVERGGICYPNPFNPERDKISIEFDAPDVSEVRIYDPFGNLIRILQKEQNESYFQWDGTNERGSVVSNGGYLCITKEYRDMYCKIAVLR